MPEGTETSTTTTTEAAPVTGADEGGLLNAPSTQPTDATSAQTAQVTEPEVKTEPIVYSLKAPEGYDVKGFEEFARTNEVPAEVAQTLLDREIALAKSREDALAKEFEQISKVQWVQAIKADPVLGGANFEKSKATANRAWDAVPDNVKAEVFKNNLQNHPALFKLLHHFGNGMKESQFIRSGDQNQSELPSTAKFYGK